MPLALMLGPIVAWLIFEMAVTPSVSRRYPATGAQSLTPPPNGKLPPARLALGGPFFFTSDGIRSSSLSKFWTRYL